MIVPLVIACALFMETLDSTVIATAIPVISRSLDESPLALNLAMTAYMLSLAVFIPLSGWLADRFGARRVFCSAIVIFTASSLGCAMAFDLNSLLLARIVQGMGGAMMMPVGRLILLRTIPKSQFVQAMSWVVIPALIGPAVGPLLGGFIATYWSWRWIFLINLPIGLLGLGLALRFIGPVIGPRPGKPDIAGFLLVGLGLGAFAFGVDNVGRGLMPPAVIVAGFLVSAAALAVYARHALTSQKPALNLRLLSIPTFRISVIGGSLFRIGIGTVPFLLPLMFQLGFGLTPLGSGALTFATAIGAMSMKVVAPKILRLYGFRRLLTWNTLLSGGLLAATGLLRPETPYAVILALLLASGFFRSLQFTCINAVGFADVDDRRMSNATSFTSVMQQMSMGMGVAFGALLLNLMPGVDVTSGTRSMDPAVFTPIFACAGLVCATSWLLFRRLSPEAGEEMSGYRQPAE
ncbi:MAG: MFS transporter [Alphaproteobacteria bacterium]|nr:MFS transporter [Alphaproteobacteria bacterium]